MVVRRRAGVRYGCGHWLVMLRLERAEQPAVKRKDQQRGADADECASPDEASEHDHQPQRDEQRLDRAVRKDDAELVGGLALLYVDARALLVRFFPFP